jgi:hypothetical protein
MNVLRETGVLVEPPRKEGMNQIQGEVSLDQTQEERRPVDTSPKTPRFIELPRTANVLNAGSFEKRQKRMQPKRKP